MDTSIATIKAKLKEELKRPDLGDLKYTYIIQKIKLLNKRTAKIRKPGSPV